MRFNIVTMVSSTGDAALKTRACLSVQRFADLREMAAHMPLSLVVVDQFETLTARRQNVENVTSTKGCNLASYRDSYIDKRRRGTHADSSASDVKTASRLAKTREDDSQSSKG